MQMLQKKVCMVGAFAVGKTSLVQRIVSGIFSEKYLTTVGVKIDKAEVETSGGVVTLILWDIAGEDGFQSFNIGFLNGASGLIFVIDATRRSTVDMAVVLKGRVETGFGQVPAIALVNKSDLTEQDELTPEDIARIHAEFPCVLRTSAKNGTHVEQGFRTLAEQMSQSPTRLARRS
jgi:small GTP-binding protein